MTTNLHPAFTQPREETDIDLVQSVRALLQSSGLKQELLDAFETNQYIKDAATMRPEGQRFLLNRFWSIQLINFGTSTIEERYCLIDCGSYEEWLRLFQLKIVPTCVRLRLPKIIT